nr:hypothetical protein [Tanacetum cinerariifolium]
MELETTQTSTTAKLPMLKQCNYEMWRLRIEQFFQVQDYALWDVIECGNSFKPIAQTTTNDAGTTTTLIPGLVTTEEKVQKKNDVKARKTRFGGNEATKKTQKTLLNLPFEWNTHVVVWRNKPDLDTMSINDIYNNFKIVEQEVKRTANSNSSSQNMAFVSSPSTNSTNEVYTAYGVSTASTQSSTTSTQKIRKEITINGSDTAGFDKSKVECYNYHKMGHFTREYRGPRNQDSRNRYQDNSQRTVNIKETPPNAMVVINGVGFDWSYMAKDEVPTNITLMAFLNSEVYTNNTFSKTYLKSYETLKKQYDDLRIEFNKSEFNLATYQRGLASIEEQLVFYKKNEVRFYEQIIVLKRDISYKDSKISVLKSELKKLKKEKESNQLNTENFDNASKSLDKLIGSQIPDNSKKGLGYESYYAVPPPPTGLFLPPKLDLSNSDIPNELKEHHDALLVKDMVLENKDCSVGSPVVVEKKTDVPTIAKVKFLRHKQQEKPVRKPVKPRLVNTVRPRAVNTARPNSAVVNSVKANQDMLSLGKEKMVEELLMCDKKNSVLFTNIRCLVLSLDSKLADESQGKQHKASCKSEVQNSISQPLFMLHMDSFGPTFMSNLMHKKYGLVATDDYNRYTWAFFLASKDETIDILKKFITEIENLVDKKVKQNGVAERRNRTLIEAARTMLADSKLPTTFWAEAVNTACYVQNRALVVKPHNKTPYELFRVRLLGYTTLEIGELKKTCILGSWRINLVSSNGPEWLFDIDMLTKSMNYVQVMAGTNSDDFTDVSPLFDSSPKLSDDAGSPSFGDSRKKHDEASDKESGASNKLNYAFENLNTKDPDDPKMLGLETIATNDYSEEEADFTNLESLIQVSPTPTIETHKNHPLEQGYTQEGIDYNEAFAPVAGIKAIRLFLAYASFIGFMVYQMDVKSAFLYERIKEEELCTEFERLMKDKFQISSMRELSFFLGLQVRPKEDGIFISQDKYVVEVLRKFSFSDVKSANTLVDMKKTLVKDVDGDDVDVHLYRSMIGSLMCLTSSRPDIMYAVCVRARFQVTPKVKQSSMVGFGEMIQYKLTTGLIYTSCIKQFWATTKVKTVNEEEQIQTLVDKKKLTLIGYENLTQKLTFYKAFFSPQWKFLIHTILQCLSSKATAWNEFSSTMAFAIILFLDSQVKGMLKHKKIYVTPSYTKKILANIKRQGKDFSGKVTPLFETMMVQPQEDMGEDSEIPTDSHHTPTVTKPSTSSQPQQKQKSKKSKTKITKVSQLSDSTHDVADEHVITTSNDPLLSGEDRLKLTELMELCTQLQSRVLALETTKSDQALEIRSLKRRVKKLEKKVSKKTHKLKRLYKTRVESSKDAGLGNQEDASKQGRMIADPDADEGIALVDETQQRNDQDMFDTSIFDDEEVVADKEVSTADPVTTAGEVVTTTGVEVSIATADYELAARLQEEEREELTIEEKSRLFVELVDKRKKHSARLRAKKIRISFVPMDTELVKGSEKAEKGSEKAAEDSSKRAVDKLEQENAKRQRIKEENEFAELKRCLEIIHDNDNDVIIEATPLSSKSPTIVYYKIYKEGRKRFFKIIIEDGNSQNYLTFLKMFKNFNREDLEVLWSIIKSRFKKIKPVDDMDNLLFQTLKTMFEHHVEDNI